MRQTYSLHRNRKFKNNITVNTVKLYGKYSHPFGIIYNQKNISIRKNTPKKLPFFTILNCNKLV